MPPPVNRDPATQAAAGSRAHGAPPRAGRVPPAEQRLLRTHLGALLRAERRAAGLGTRRLALAVGCDRRTLQRLEVGQQRPRLVLLRYLASVLAVDDPAPLAERLIEAAGSSIRPDTPTSVRQRRKRADAAILAGHQPLPAALARRLALHRAADAAHGRALALLGQAGVLDDVAVLAEAQRLLEESRRLREQAGPPIVIRVGRHEIRAGWGT